MAFHVEDAAEAYAAISLLVVGADGVGTQEERRFLFDELSDASVFAGHDEETFGALLGTLVGRMYADAAGDDSLTADSVGEICAGARDVLDDGQCRELFSFAVRVAYSDGLETTEEAFLTHIRDGLGVDAESAQEILDQVVD